MLKHLYIECTHTSGSELKTGIQRVVRKVVEELGEQLSENTPITLIKIDNGMFYSLDSLGTGLKVEQETGKAEVLPSLTFKSKLHKLARDKRQDLACKVKWKPLNNFLIAPKNEFGLYAIIYMLSLIGVYKKIKALLNKVIDPEGANASSAIVFVEGDVILLLDSSWHLPAWGAIKEAKKNGAVIIAVIYDLIPITHPQFCEQALCKVFNIWFEKGKTNVDGYIAISQTVMRSVQDYLISKNEIIEHEKFGYFYLGADISEVEERARVELKNTISKEDSYLIVSTIEPRKNHQYLFDVFTKLWAKGEHVKLHIVGRVGWKVRELIKKMEGHPQFNKQLFIWNDLDDAELVYCYKNSKALVFPSYVEGFGLPIIEAQHYHLPVLASDTSIHREIGKENIIYFDINDTTDLTNKISEIEAGNRLLKQNDNFDFEEFTWKRSTERLINEVQRISALL